MGKNPAFLFYPNDWTIDTAMLPLEIKGAWIDLLCSMWWNGERGTITGTYEDFGRLLRIETEKAKTIIEELIDKKVCNVERYNSVRYNEKLTLISRRMAREEKNKKNNRIRQARYYNKRKPNADITLASPVTVTVTDNNTTTTSFECEFFTVTNEEVKDYLKAYNTTEEILTSEFIKMKRWLINNPDKRKKNYGRFIGNWLTRHFNDNGKGGGEKSGADKKRELDDYIERTFEGGLSK